MTHKQLLDKLTTKHGLLLNYHMVALTDNIKIRTYQNLTCVLEPCQAYKALNGTCEFDFIFMRQIDHWFKIIIITEHSVKPKDVDESEMFQNGEWTQIIENWGQNVKPIQIDIAILKSQTQAYKLANYN